MHQNTHLDEATGKLSESDKRFWRPIWTLGSGFAIIGVIVFVRILFSMMDRPVDTLNMLCFTVFVSASLLAYSFEHDDLPAKARHRINAVILCFAILGAVYFIGMLGLIDPRY